MSNSSPIQKALGEHWQQLPPALQSHHQNDTNSDRGNLDIDYPLYMHPYLTFLHFFGALIDRRCRHIYTIVEKHMCGDVQFWKRIIHFPDNKKIYFKSYWVYDHKNELTEFINTFIGLRMAVYTRNNKLFFKGRHFVLKIAKIVIPIPQWLILGSTTIVETAINETEFEMDFRLTHPLFGEVYRYSGQFKNMRNFKAN